MPPSCAFLRISLSVLLAETQVMYLPRYGSSIIFISSLKRSSNYLADIFKFGNHVEVEERSRTGTIAGAALDAEVTLTLRLPELHGDRPYWTGGSTGAAAHAEALVDHIAHQVAEASCRAALGKVHERL